MATSKKADRKTNLVQLLNTLNGGVLSEDKQRVIFSAENHTVITNHVKKMLAEDGVFVMSN